MEKIRRFLRTRLGATSPAYRLGARLYTDLAIIRREGLGSWSKLRHMQTQPIAPAEAIAFSRLKHPFFLRPGTKDIQTAIDNFVREEYGEFRLPSPPRFMIDAGAYVGDTSAYFLSRYPDLQILALEPSEESLELARLNLRPFGARVVLHQKALAGRPRRISLTGRQTGTKMQEAHQGEDTEVEATTLHEILKMAPGQHIDILKMDIEGAEREVFECGLEEWAPHVNTVIVEPHGADIELLMTDRMAKLGWRIERRRNLFCFGNPRVWQTHDKSAA